MNFTDIFIRRPVLAVTLSLLILVLGLRALTNLSVRQFPKTQNAVVTVSTAYYGADAETVAGFITQPLEGAIAQAQGIDYLSSTSSTGVSTIIATLRLNYDANRALTEINTQVNSVRNQLPPEAQQPVLTVQVGETIDSMYMGFFSDTLPNNNVTDYLVRVVKPKLDSVEGVQTAEILGARQFALRAWLDPQRMAAYGVTASDVRAALASNNYLAALGPTKGQMVSVDLTAGTSLHSVDEFKRLTIRQKDGAIVRLEDVADGHARRRELRLHDRIRRPQFRVHRHQGRARRQRARRGEARAQRVSRRSGDAMPTGLTGQIVYDGTKFIQSSIDEVEKTLVLTLVIVSVVIFLFLGSLRAVAIPLIAMPLSLIGAFFVMLLLGYSINLLTLLALVLAIGLVVDDAIIVVENVDRHMKEEGKPPLEASLVGARELGGPIIAMTIVLVAVYIPIGFQGGLTGALFTEFAFTLAGAVAVSGIVALTLSPMMTSRIFRAEQEERPLRPADRPHVRPAAYRLPAAAAQPARHVDRVRRDGPAAARRRRLPVHDVEVGALAAGGPGHRAGADPRAAERDAAADGRVREAGVRHRARAARVRPDVPDHRRAGRQPGHRRRAVQAVERAQAQRRRAAAGAAEEMGRHRRRHRRRVPVPGRCRARAACRCSS